MTSWAALGCVRYGRREARRKLLEAALDDTAAQFARTGTIWEFYHPDGRHPEDVKRKSQTKRNQPFTEYLGHNHFLRWRGCGNNSRTVRIRAVLQAIGTA